MHHIGPDPEGEYDEVTHTGTVTFNEVGFWVTENTENWGEVEEAGIGHRSCAVNIEGALG